MDYVPLPRVKKLLEAEEKDRELTNEQKLALAHAQQFSEIAVTKGKKLYDALCELEHISEINAVKLVDMMPTHPDDVKAIFSKERFTLTDEQIEEILKIVREHV